MMRPTLKLKSKIASSAILAAMLAACVSPAGQPAAPSAPKSEPAAATQAPAPEPTKAPAEPEAPAAGAKFDPDNEKDAVDFNKLADKIGAAPKVSKPYKIGVVVKFLGNQYWKLLADGMAAKAKELGVTIDVQAAQTEADQLGQLAIMETMIEKKYDALLVSPQTDTNLLPAVEKAKAAGIYVLNVNDAVLPDAVQWVGPNQYENGMRAAKFLIKMLPDAGKVAVIEGQAGVYAAKQRTKGFKETLNGTKFEVVASVPGDWDRQKSLDAATTIIQQHPDIKAFYCNNDTMALGVVEAVKNANQLGKIMVIGTDGVDAAYDSIKKGEMTGTVDSFPFITGQTAVEVLIRLLEGQKVPRAVFSPQNLIVKANLEKPTDPPYAEGAAAAAAPAAGAKFDPDNEKDAVDFNKLADKIGAAPKVSKPYKIGVVVKFLGNQYWKLLAEGMAAKAKELGVTVDVQAAQTEADQLGQLAIMETMIEKKYDALLVSPQTDTNLLPAVEKAKAAGIYVLNVNDAVLPDAVQWVGPNQYENGMRAAKFLIKMLPDAGKVAVIEGQAGVYAAKQRTKGFKETLNGTKFEVVASVPGDWDRQKSLDAATTIIQQHPDIKAFYCNNDTMALGVVEAVKNANMLGKILVIGTDGVDAAYDSIKKDEMTGTVDSFPFITGQTAVEVLVRLLEGQKVPRAVFSPQNLIIKANVDKPQEQQP